MNPTEWDRAITPPAPLPQNRAQRRAARQHFARAERAKRRSRARAQRALTEYMKEFA